jgi:hypothetical protein
MSKSLDPNPQHFQILLESIIKYRFTVYIAVKVIQSRYLVNKQSLLSDPYKIGIGKKNFFS